MTRYELRLRSASGLRVSVASTELTQALVASVLPTGTKFSLTPLVDGYGLAVDLDRQDHAQAMTDMESAFRQLGFSVLQSAIIEFASSWLEGGAIGTVGGALLGAATKSAEGFLALVLAGLVIGALRQTARAQYIATPTAGGWQITRRDSSPAAGAQPAF